MLSNLLALDCWSNYDDLVATIDRTILQKHTPRIALIGAKGDKPFIILEQIVGMTFAAVKKNRVQFADQNIRIALHRSTGKYPYRVCIDSTEFPCKSIYSIEAILEEHFDEAKSELIIEISEPTIPELEIIHLPGLREIPEDVSNKVYGLSRDALLAKKSLVFIAVAANSTTLSANQAIQLVRELNKEADSVIALTEAHKVDALNVQDLVADRLAGAASDIKECEIENVIDAGSTESILRCISEYVTAFIKSEIVHPLRRQKAEALAAAQNALYELGPEVIKVAVLKRIAEQHLEQMLKNHFEEVTQNIRAAVIARYGRDYDDRYNSVNMLSVQNGIFQGSFDHGQYVDVSRDPPELIVDEFEDAKVNTKRFRYFINKYKQHIATIAEHVKNIARYKYAARNCGSYSPNIHQSDWALFQDVRSYFNQAIAEVTEKIATGDAQTLDHCWFDWSDHRLVIEHPKYTQDRRALKKSIVDLKRSLDVLVRIA